MSFLSRWLRPTASISREPLPADPAAPPWPAQGLWARAAYMRLSDWFKQMSDWTLDVRKIIYDARLPEPLPGLIYLGVRRSRRSRRQRVVLARELIAACSASLAAGQSPRQVADDFRAREARGDFLPRSKRPAHFARELPAPAVRWIDRVLAAARLQPALANQAAAELAEHFAARLASGGSIETLIEQFGEPAQAAQLLRQTRLAMAVMLPARLRELLNQVLRRARLWPAERQDVARELTDHFSDGLAAGRTAEKLAADFGSPRQAARLIRRAKLRNRPLVWRMLHHSTQGFAALLGLLLLAYCFLCVRYVTGRPTISHNYVAAFNREQLVIPPDDRAWPLYRQALLQLPQSQRPDARGFEEQGSEAEEYWPGVVAYLDEHHKTLTLIRRAASKPQFGFVFGDPANRKFLQEFGGGADRHGESPERYDPVLIECLLPQHQEVRFLAQLLAADARSALQMGDPARFVEDVSALVGMAEQNRNSTPFLVVKLVSSAIYQLAVRATAAALAEQPELFAGEQLKQLAHALAGYAGGGSLQLHVSEGDRQSFYDYLQRTFTDDGHGDGRLTPEGFKRLNRDFNQAFTPDRLTLVWRTWGIELGLGGPLASAEIASRKELTALAEQLWDEAQADYACPLWEWQESSADKKLDELRASPLNRIRYWPVLDFLGAETWMAPLVGELDTQRRDAVFGVIALELYHRRHSAWPATLDELTPDLLPDAPLDRFTGQPLRYRLVDGRPLLYSCGTDGDDDGGRAPKEGSSAVSSWEPRAKLDADTIAIEWATSTDGDWILWPPVKTL